MTASKKKPSRPRPRIDLAGVVEPSTRVFTDWTDQRIRNAEHAANRGDLRLAAEFCEWLLADDRVSSGFHTRVQTLFGLTPTFEASGDKRRRNRAVKALDAEEDWWTAYPESEIALLHTWGLLLGVAPARHRWTEFPGHGGRALPCPEFWHPQHLRQDQNTRRWMIHVAREGAAFTYGVEEELVPGSGEWILHMPYGKNRPWAWGLWRPLGRMVLIKQLAHGDWSRSGEKAAILALTIALQAASAVTDSSGRPKEALRQLATDIYNRGRNGVAALPPGVDLKAVDTVIKAKELYGSPIDLINEAITILIRGGNLGTLAEGGSRAAAEVQERTADLPRLRFDAQSITTTIHDQSLVHWAEFNFGDPELAPWPVYPVEPQENLKAKTDVESKAFENVEKAEALGFEVDRAKFLESHKIDWVKPGQKPKLPTVTKGDLVEQGGGHPGLPAPGGLPPEDGDAEETDDDSRNVRRGPRLASGASTAANGGFLDGQLYVDALVERSTDLSRAALKATRDAILEELDAATGYDDLRERLRRRFEGLSPEDLSEIVHRAMLMGGLAGLAAVTQDS